MTFIPHLLHRIASHGLSPWLGTGCLLLATLGLSRLGDYSVKTNAKSVDVARTLRIGLRYGLTVFFLTGLSVVWAEQVKHLMFAAAALLASLLLISKDLALCLLGDIVKFYGKLCPIGEVVEIEGVKGVVVDSGFLTTSLQVIEHSYSGKVVTFPNAVFLTKAVGHLSKTGDFRLVFVRIPVAADARVETLEHVLLAIVREVAGPYEAEASTHLGRARETLLMDFPSTEPRVLLEPKSFEEVVLAARFFCPASKRSAVEQEILKRFYQAYGRT